MSRLSFDESTEASYKELVAFDISSSDWRSLWWGLATVLSANESNDWFCKWCNWD